MRASAAARRCSPTPRRRRGRSKRRSAPSTARLSRCAIGIRRARRRRARSQSGRRTRSSVCRSTRNSRRRRRRRRLRTGGERQRNVGLDRPTRAVCCYPAEAGFIAALAGLIRPVLDASVGAGKAAAAAADRAWPAAEDRQRRRSLSRAGRADRGGGRRGARRARARLAVCYQSRVGPLEWIGPATDAEIRRAGAERRRRSSWRRSRLSRSIRRRWSSSTSTIAELAENCGVPGYLRVPTVGVEPAFIAALAASSAARAWRPDCGRAAVAGGRCALAGASA